MNCDGIVKNPGGITKTALVLCAPKGAAYLTSEGRLLVCLVRHGQTDWNIERRLQGREPVPLNAVGIEQSEKCGELFTAAREAGLEIDKAYTSPLGRAEETANAITDALGIGRAERVEALIERDYGALSGLSLDERRALYKSGKTDVGVESIDHTASRIKGWLADVAREKRCDHSRRSYKRALFLHNERHDRHGKEYFRELRSLSPRRRSRRDDPSGIRADRGYVL